MSQAVKTSDRMYAHAVRVPYAHTDQMGYVYYANYLVYFEMARSSLLREAGVPVGDLERRGVFLPVTSCACEFRMPAHYDEQIEVRCRLSLIRKTRLHIDYEVVRGSDVLVTGYTEHVCLNREGKVTRAAPELVRLVMAD